VPLSASPQSLVEAGNTTEYCNSGTVGGAGTATVITCPSPRDGGPASDAGAVTDAGTADAGMRDAGSLDSGIRDAGNMDAGVNDGGTAPDAGEASTAPPSCGCGIAAGDAQGSVLLWLALMAATAFCGRAWLKKN
jgi:hypothetical protein